MKTTVVTDKIPRWTGEVADIVAVVGEAKKLVDQFTSKDSSCYATVTQDTVETNFEDLNDFASSTGDNLRQVEKITLTIGDFNADTALSARIEFDSNMASPAVLVRARGHDPILVDGLITQLRTQLRKGRRWFSWGWGPIQWIVLGAYLIGNYLYIRYVGFPAIKNDLLYYLFIVFIVALPTFVVIWVIKLVNWFVPTLELRPPKIDTRARRYRTRAIASFGSVVVTSILIPIFVDQVKEWLKPPPP
jgi:hypothetical protein